MNVGLNTQYSVQIEVELWNSECGKARLTVAMSGENCGALRSIAAMDCEVES